MTKQAFGGRSGLQQTDRMKDLHQLVLGATAMLKCLGRWLRQWDVDGSHDGIEVLEHSRQDWILVDFGLRHQDIVLKAKQGHESGRSSNRVHCGDGWYPSALYRYFGWLGTSEAEGEEKRHSLLLSQRGLGCVIYLPFAHHRHTLGERGSRPPLRMEGGWSCALIRRLSGWHAHWNPRITSCSGHKRGAVDATHHKLARLANLLYSLMNVCP